MTIATERLRRSFLPAAILVVESVFYAGGAAAQGLPASGDTAGSGATGTSPEAVPRADQGGSPTAAEQSDPRPANYEFAFVSVAAYQTWAIAGRWLYLGAGGGVGPPLYRFSKVGSRDPAWDTSVQVLSANAFVRLSPIPYLDLDVGPKIAITSETYQAPDPPQSGFAYGGIADLRVGSKTIKVGPRFEFERVAYYNYYENAWRITPLMLRVYH